MLALYLLPDVKKVILDIFLLNLISLIFYKQFLKRDSPYKIYQLQLIELQKQHERHLSEQLRLQENLRKQADVV